MEERARRAGGGAANVEGDAHGAEEDCLRLPSLPRLDQALGPERFDAPEDVRAAKVGVESSFEHIRPSPRSAANAATTASRSKRASGGSARRVAQAAQEELPSQRGGVEGLVDLERAPVVHQLCEPRFQAFVARLDVDRTKSGVELFARLPDVLVRLSQDRLRDRAGALSGGAIEPDEK